MPGLLVNKLYDFKGHRDSVFALTESNNTNQFFSAGADGLVAGWDLDHPDQGNLIAKIPNSVYALHYLPTENWLVVGHNQDGVHIVDISSKKELASCQLGPTPIFDIQSYNNQLFVASGDGSISILEIDGLKVIKKIQSSSSSVRCLAINTKSGDLAAGYSDHYIRIFSLDDFQLKQEWKAHDNSVFSVRYTHDHNSLISGSRDARLKRWVVFPKYDQIMEVPAHLYAINNLAFSPDGKHFITCSLDKTIKVWETESMKLLKVLDRARHGGHITSVNKVLWLSDNRLVSASDDRNISIWNIHFG